jgi:hypothetical protein
MPNLRSLQDSAPYTDNILNNYLSAVQFTF